MSVDLVKGGRVNLNKQSSTHLNRVRFGLGWSPNPYDGQAAFDLDVTAFACKQVGEKLVVVSDKHIIFYNNKDTPSGSIHHSGDNRDGAAEGDDESIVVDLNKLLTLDQEVVEISIVVTIFEADKNNQNFGQVKNSYIKAYNDETGEVLSNFSLEDAATENTAVQFGSLLKRDNEWVFSAVGNGFKRGLGDFVKFYGADVA